MLFRELDFRIGEILNASLWRLASKIRATTRIFPEITGLVRLSSVVVAELWRGATRALEQQFLRDLEKNLPILTPTEKNWLESGRILAKIYADEGYEPKKLRDLHFDVLIALTVRSYGAQLITSNRADFELIASTGNSNWKCGSPCSPMPGGWSGFSCFPSLVRVGKSWQGGPLAYRRSENPTLSRGTRRRVSPSV